MTIAIHHYYWAGLDFMIDEEDVPVFLEANRCSHMLKEYVALGGGDEPFRLTAALMNEADGPPCLLWRRRDPEPNADEDACWIAAQLQPHITRPALIGHVEDNQDDEELFLTRDGQRVQPGSLFRWWYPLPWSHERNGVRVINPNSVWLAVRDKLQSYQHLAGAKHFRVPTSFAVESLSEAHAIMERHPEVFRRGYVVKPRTGFGGHGVRVGDAHTRPDEVPANSMLCERIVPRLVEGQWWDVRVFAMAGRYLGGLRRRSEKPVTNVFQGGRAELLTRALAEQLEVATLEAVKRLDEAAAVVHSTPQPHDSLLTRVTW
jgi:hypothetical protein